MLFNTVSYVAFLVLAVALYWALPVAGRKWLLLAASFLFYALWRVEFVLLIAFSAFVDYFFSLKIYDERHPLWRKAWLLCSLSTNLGLLAYFKYTYFFLDNMAGVGMLWGQDWRFDVGAIVLPLGISFYTFLSISYTLDVYRRLFEPIRNVDVYLTYVMFWPHMISGPILRAHELIPQITRVHNFKLEEFADAVKVILFGLFLKVVLADQIAPLVNDAFAAKPATLSALDVWTMAFGFGLQIYFDFAGYSMVAIGSARLLGIRFPENFNWPYLATSPREFWKRWHITLSSWIRDYLYLPLSGMGFRDRSEGGIEVQFLNRGNTARLTAALFVTWFLMGLWHGARWNFAAWGLWHAGFIFAYRLTSGRLGALPEWVRRLGGWCVTVAVAMLGWIPFRAQSLQDTFALLGRVLDWRAYTYLSLRENIYLVVAVVFAGMLLLWYVTQILSAKVRPAWIHAVAEIGGLTVVMIFVFIFLRPISQFIYFQF